MARSGRLRSGAAAKLKRWRKGHSSDCNPETRQHRLAARSRFCSRPAGESRGRAGGQRPAVRAGAPCGQLPAWARCGMQGRSFWVPCFRELGWGQEGPETLIPELQPRRQGRDSGEEKGSTA